MNALKLTLAVAISWMLAQSVAADDDFWVGVKAGTLGLGVEATWRPVPYLDVRAGYNGFNYEDTRTEAGVEYDGELALSSFYGTANLRVPLSPFRITAGIFSNGNEIILNSIDSTAVQIGGTTYQASELGTLEARGAFDSVAPYAGVGLDFRLADTFGLHFDAGVLFQGKAAVTMAADGPIASNALFMQELEAERLQLEEAVEDYEHYPVVSLGFSVNF